MEGHEGLLFFSKRIGVISCWVVGVIDAFAKFDDEVYAHPRERKGKEEKRIYLFGILEGWLTGWWY